RQLECALAAGLPTLAKAGRLPCRGRKLSVAAAARAAATEYGPGAGMRQVDDEVSVTVEDLRAHRAQELDLLAVGAVLARAAAVTAATPSECALPAEA